MIRYTENMLKQFRKSMITIFDYVPTKYKATPLEWKVRKFVWGFKDGKEECSSYAAKIVAKELVKEYGMNADIVFTCIPASSGEKTEKRYKQFSDIVCKLSGARNGYSAIKVEGEKLAIHESGRGKRIENTEIINFDKEFFLNQKVVVFDDVITKGYSYARFASHLESLGASVVGGLFLAKTMIH